MKHAFAHTKERERDHLHRSNECVDLAGGVPAVPAWAPWNLRSESSPDILGMLARTVQAQMRHVQQMLGGKRAAGIGYKRAAGIGAEEAEMTVNVDG